MDRRGRPAKVKAVSRKFSKSCSDRGSSSSPERYLFQSSLSKEDNLASSSLPQHYPRREIVGLSWISVLKGSNPRSGKPSDPPAVHPSSPDLVPVVCFFIPHVVNPSPSPPTA